MRLRKPGRLVRTLQRTGALNHRNLFWSWYSPLNFGDWIGPYLYRRLTGRKPLYCSSRSRPPCTFFQSAGSILQAAHHEDVAVVWGSGILSRTDVPRRPRAIHAVRGPHTRARCLELGFECPDVYGDPAILLPTLLRPAATGRATLGIVPHFVDLPSVRGMYGHLPGTRIVDVRQDVETVVGEICACEHTISSSLHGLIVSHAYGIPSAWARFSDHLAGDGVKFQDYFAAGGIRETVAPVEPGPDATVDSLVSAIRAAPVPDYARLVAPLLAACPFRR